MKAVIGEKLRIVRLAFGWAQNDVADKLAIPQSHLSEMESGLRPIPEQISHKIQFLTGFSAKFFESPLKRELLQGSNILYRRSKNKFRKSDSFQAYCQIVFDTFEPLSRFAVPSGHKIPKVADADAKTAAAFMRNALGIREGVPVTDLTYKMEISGVRVIAIGKPQLNAPLESTESTAFPQEPLEDDFQAFSFWSHDDLPVIFLRTDISADRMNWATGHELAHLILHFAYRGQVKDAERSAQQATSEFFLPETEFRQSLTRISLQTIQSLAVKWNVSPKSIVIRASDLNLINAAQKGYYFKLLSQHESIIRNQRPRYYRQLCELLYPSQILTMLHKETGASKAFLREVLEAHEGHSEL